MPPGGSTARSDNGSGRAAIAADDRRKIAAVRRVCCMAVRRSRKADDRCGTAGDQRARGGQGTPRTVLRRHPFLPAAPDRAVGGLSPLPSTASHHSPHFPWCGSRAPSGLPAVLAPPAGAVTGPDTAARRFGRCGRRGATSSELRVDRGSGGDSRRTAARTRLDRTGDRPYRAGRRGLERRAPADAPEVQRGIAWLQANQRTSGRW